MSCSFTLICVSKLLYFIWLSGSTERQLHSGSQHRVCCCSCFKSSRWWPPAAWLRLSSTCSLMSEISYSSFYIISLLHCTVFWGFVEHCKTMELERKLWIIIAEILFESSSLFSHSQTCFGVYRMFLFFTVTAVGAQSSSVWTFTFSNSKWDHCVGKNRPITSKKYILVFEKSFLMYQLR